MNECPVNDCGTRVPSHMLMCARHWYMVPAPMRNDVWRTYKRDGVLSEEYQEARDAAIAHVNSELKLEGKDAPSSTHHRGDRRMGHRHEGDVLSPEAPAPDATTTTDAADA